MNLYHFSLPKYFRGVKPCFSFLTPYQSNPTSANGVATHRGSCHFTIRTAQTKDLNNLAEILADSFHTKTGYMGWLYPIFRLGIYEDLHNRLRSDSPYYFCLVAVADSSKITSYQEDIAGTVEIALRSPFYWQKGSHQYPYISNLAISKTWRRHGAAQKLLLGCEEAAREWGFRHLYLHVLENNHQARQLYLKAGYRIQQVEPSYNFGWLGHPKRLFLQKQLN